MPLPDYDAPEPTDPARESEPPPPPPPMHPVLLAAFPRNAVLEVPPCDFAVGADRLAAAGVPDPGVSRAHAVFRRAHGGLVVEDAGSEGGTWVDGERLRPGEARAVSDGVMVRMGRTILVYRDDLLGELAPAAPLGDLVAPFGLRELREEVGDQLLKPGKLLVGEPGTGKSLVARATASALRPERPFGVVSVRDHRDLAFHASLFGSDEQYHPTGFGRGTRGLLADCEGGAVYLDELTDLPHMVVSALKDYFDGYGWFPVSGNRHARHGDLLFLIGTRHLSFSKFYNQPTWFTPYCSLVPALRERAEDIFAIALGLAERHRRPLHTDRVDVESVERMMLHPWENNVDELFEVVLLGGVLDGDGGIRPEALDRELRGTRGPVVLTRDSVVEAMEDARRDHWLAASALLVSTSRLRRFLRENT
jgi:FHA domain-containing protein/sigma-54 interacting transcriptional regulator